MKLHVINAINATVLILLSGWRYYEAHTPSTSNLVPIFFGVMMLVCNQGIEYDNRAMRNMGFALTILVILGLVNQLYHHYNIYNEFDNILIYIMIASSVISLVFYIIDLTNKMRK